MGTAFALAGCRDYLQNAEWYSLYTSPTDFIENRLCFFRIWKAAVTKLFARILSAGDVVADVGASVAYYRPLASRLIGPGCHIFAVEASGSIRKQVSATRN